MNTIVLRLMSVSFAVVLLTLAGCSRTQSLQTLDAFYPIMSNGQQWEFHQEFGTISKGMLKATVRYRVAGEETINGKTYIKVITEALDMPGIEPAIAYLRRTPEGIYRINDKHKDLPEYLETPFPLTIGKTWIVPDPDGALDYRAESIETVDTPYGRFENCLKVSFRSHNGAGRFGMYEGYSYHSPKIGEVKDESKLDDVSFVLVLTDYKP